MMLVCVDFYSFATFLHRWIIINRTRVYIGIFNFV